MIHIRSEIRRLQRAQEQTFNIVKTHVDHIVIVLGATGNAYIVCIKPSRITCNCPDSHQACKHILFLISITGLIKKKSQVFVTISAESLVQRLSAIPPSPQLQAVFLDPHTNDLCSAHNYHPCFFCAQNPAGSIIVCSECGCLGHVDCYENFLHQENNNVTFANNCPRCGFLFTPLKCPYDSGFRNFFSVLNYFNFRTSNTNNHDFETNNRNDRNDVSFPVDNNGALVFPASLPDLNLPPQMRDV